MAGFQDQTSAWFTEGENPEVIAHTKEVERAHQRRWLRVLGGCIALAIAGAAVAWMLLGREPKSQAAPIVTPAPATLAAVSTPQQTATPAPTKLPAEKPLDRSAEWRREDAAGES